MPEAEKTEERLKLFLEHLLTEGKVAFRKPWFRLPSLNSNHRQDVEDIAWQRFRGQRLKGLPTSEKLEKLADWISIWWSTDYEKKAVRQVLNYLESLKRGGFIREKVVEELNHLERTVAGEWWEVLK
jgi:hypothetical protein